MITNFTISPRINSITKHRNKQTTSFTPSKDCVIFSGNKKNPANLKTRLKSLIADTISFNGNYLQLKFSKTEQSINKDLNKLEEITPASVNSLITKHLKDPKRLIVKDISELPTERKSHKPVITHRTMNLQDSSVVLYLDPKANKEQLQTFIMSEVRSHLEDLEIQKTTSTFRKNLITLKTPDKTSIEKIIKELHLSDKIKIVDSSTEEVLEYYKQFPAICVLDTSTPDKPVSTLYVNLSMSKIDIEQSTVHEFVHALQTQKDRNFFIDNETLSKTLRTIIDLSTKNLDNLLQSVINSEVNYFDVIKKSDLIATGRKFDLFKAAIARELQQYKITDFNNYLEKIQLWALHEAEAYKEGNITIKANPDFPQIAQSNSGRPKEKFIGTSQDPVFVGLELLPRYYQEFANSINAATD